jgi:REP element-mobilizing transposase RayT/type I restriction-modification system DNA methylase subunit
MGIFQKSVINKHLKTLDDKKVKAAYEQFKEFYGNKIRLHNIMQLKEENYQEGFLREVFVDTLGYTINPNENYNLTTEYKNLKDARKADGAVLKNGKAIGVIELKSTKTKNLESIKEQAFGYKNNQPGCKYVITSNFQKLRLYIDNSTEYEEFDLFNLEEKDFAVFWLLLSKESLFNDLPDTLKKETKFHENNISDKLYADYKSFKNRIFENLVKNNTRYDKLELFKKSQKLLDRFLFVLFAEDSGLIPPNTISKIIEQWKQLQELDEYMSLYSRFQKLFAHLDKGHTYKKWGELPAYNGGLFREDEILDDPETTIDDEILEKDSLNLSRYDFNTEVDVNILGHIFEHSLNEIEQISAKLKGEAIDKKKTKRKKDGIFYTPKYITKYIVENTVGTLCQEKKQELDIDNLLIDETYRKTDGKLKKKGKQLFDTLNAYKKWLLKLKILDPACGSGAFLNQTLDFLMTEHQEIDDRIAELEGKTDTLRLHDTDKSILENNIYGVDINEESVEIAKLALWLRTAQRGRPLSDLSGNIKCGNSLIDDPKIAGDKAFDWQKEFPQIFKPKEKEAWHLTFALHNSRFSTDADGLTQRFAGKTPDTPGFIARTYPEFSEQEEEIMAEELAKAAKKYNINITACNICKDHVHALIVCEKEELSYLAGKWKGRAAYTYNRRVNPSAVAAEKAAPYSDGTKTKVWAKKYKAVVIKDKEQYKKTAAYIKNNRTKHQLPSQTDGFTRWINEMTCTEKHAFRKEYKGGFDVVIGNPPYGARISKSHFKFFSEHYETAHYKLDTFSLFIEKAIKLAVQNGQIGLIVPYTWLTIQQHSKLRKFVLSYKLLQIIDLPTKIFADADLDTVVSIIKKESNSENIKIGIINNNEIILTKELSFVNIKKNPDYLINVNLSDFDYQILDKIQLNSIKLNDKFSVSQGYIPYRRSDLIKEYGNEQGNKIVDERLWHSNNKETDEFKQEIQGKDISRYSYRESYQYIKYGKHLAGYVEPLFFNSPRVLIMEVTRGDKYVLKSCYVEKEFYNTPSIINIIEQTNDNKSLKYLLATMNSSLFSWYHKKVHPKANATTSIPKILVSDIRNLPYKNISKEAQQPFIKKADQMLSLNKELQEKSERFLKRVKSNFEIEKFSKKLQNFYDYDFKTFLAELKKQKITLSLTAQDEWEEYFDSYKKEINALQSQISQTDQEIDQMVYELYGLTDEEIGIVEESVK